MDEVVIGIDLGTQGTRALAVTPQGQLVAETHSALLPALAGLPAGWIEQQPESWWESVRSCLKKLTSALPLGTKVSGVSVDSTSGTVLAVDNNGKALCPAILYNDRRSERQAERVRQVGAALQSKLGYVFGSSYALPKLLWWKESQPELFARARRFLHAADFIVGKLTGCFDYTDTSNALKTGYDLVELVWPDFIEKELGIPLDKLPQVLLPGDAMGNLSYQAARFTGLPEGTPLFAGATDGTAAQIASGAAQPGEWNSSLGTTLVLKGVAESLVHDPQGRIYFHLHPQGWWMPGGASNTGGEWIALEFAGTEPAALDRKAEECLPTKLVRYPLHRRGERFPFVNKQADGFLLGRPSNEVEKYAAGLEGTALVERLAYETVQSIGLKVGERILTTGGGSKSAVWTKVRASVLGKSLERPAVTETAMGAALLAASGVWYSGLGEATRNMVRIASKIDPDKVWKKAYEEKYTRFKEELKRRGYIS